MKFVRPRGPIRALVSPALSLISLIMIYFHPGPLEVSQGRPLPPFYLYQASLTAALVRFGDNDLELQLTRSDGASPLIAQEFEALVSAP